MYEVHLAVESDDGYFLRFSDGSLVYIAFNMEIPIEARFSVVFFNVKSNIYLFIYISFSIPYNNTLANLITYYYIFVYFSLSLSLSLSLL